MPSEFGDGIEAVTYVPVAQRSDLSDAEGPEVSTPATRVESTTVGSCMGALEITQVGGA